MLVLWVARSHTICVQLCFNSSILVAIRRISAKSSAMMIPNGSIIFHVPRLVPVLTWKVMGRVALTKLTTNTPWPDTSLCNKVKLSTRLESRHAARNPTQLRFFNGKVLIGCPVESAFRLTNVTSSQVLQNSHSAFILVRRMRSCGFRGQS